MLTGDSLSTAAHASVALRRVLQIRSHLRGLLHSAEAAHARLLSPFGLLENFPQTPAAPLGILRFAWIHETFKWDLQHASKQWRNENFDFAHRHYHAATSMGAKFWGDIFDRRADALEKASLGARIVLQEAN
jgi:hypothetical protein